MVGCVIVLQPPPLDRENSSGSREPLSPQQMAQYGQFPIDVSIVSLSVFLP